MPPARRGARRPASGLRPDEGRRLRADQLRLRRLLRGRPGRAAQPLHGQAQVRAGCRRTDFRQPATVQRRAEQLPRS